MIPIEKNIIVLDVEGRQIGVTYPKRARGLLKNGRAEYVNDRAIRLKDTRAPAVHIDTEEKTMSKVVNFNTRDFEFEDSCKSNVGFRGYVTTALGNEEIWEIGDWNWNWTQICTVLKRLEKNTDYVFRFAMTLGHNDDNREESLVHIFRNCRETQTVNEETGEIISAGTEEEQKKAWDDRYTYCIRQSRFKPVISKRDPEEDTMLRVFELPFNTGECENWKIVIVSNHAVARFFSAKDAQAYTELEDLSYEQWREQRTARLNAEREQAELAQIETGFTQGQRIAMAAKTGFSGPNFGIFGGSGKEDIESAVENAVEDAVSNAISEISDSLQERIEESINDSISEFFSEGIESFMSSHQFTMKDGTVISDVQKTKVLSPDKKKLLSCYGGITVEDTSKWNGKLPKGWGLRVQTRISSWELLYIYENEKDAIEALKLVKSAIENGEPLVELPGKDDAENINRSFE